MIDYDALDAPTVRPDNPLVVDATFMLLGDPIIVWGGTDEEEADLIAAVHAHRDCLDIDCCYRQPDDSVRDCTSHDLLNHQRVLDGLLTVRRGVAWWIDQEWMR